MFKTLVEWLTRKKADEAQPDKPIPKSGPKVSVITDDDGMISIFPKRSDGK